MKPPLLVALGLLASALPTGAEKSPLLRPVSWQARAEQTIELRAADADVQPEHARLVIRARGAQGLVHPERSEGRLVWRSRAAHEGAHIAALVFEPPADAHGRRVCRYEKVFIAVAPKEGPAAPRPSASATARFGHRLELAPMVDPTCVPPGSDLPVRVKFEGSDLPGATLVIRRLADSGDAPDADRSVSADRTGLANVRIDRPGVWVITVEHRAGGPDGAGDTCLASMSFRVAEPPRPEAGK